MTEAFRGISAVIHVGCPLSGTPEVLLEVRIFFVIMRQLFMGILGSAIGNTEYPYACSQSWREKDHRHLNYRVHDEIRGHLGC